MFVMHFVHEIVTLFRRDLEFQMHRRNIRALLVPVNANPSMRNVAPRYINIRIDP